MKSTPEDKAKRALIEGALPAGKIIPYPKEVRRTRRRNTGKAKRGNTGEGGSDGDNPNPIVRLIAGALPQNIEEVEAALCKSEMPIYRQQNRLVRPTLSLVPAAGGGTTSSYQLVALTTAHLVEMIGRAARLEKFDRRADDWVPTDCPIRLADVLLARVGLWSFEYLARVITAPTLRPDGSLLDEPGYDKKTWSLFDPCGVTFPKIPERPSRKQAAAALIRLKTLLAAFPFVGDKAKNENMAVALAAILTAVARTALRSAPMFCFTATAAGTGKTLLADTIAMIATGRPAPAIAQPASGQRADEAELEKRLGASFIAADQIVLIDNIEFDLRSSFLCQALTQSTLSVRVLGASSNVEVPTTSTILATGNNLVITGDLTRRALLCSLDAVEERPELRTFETPDPVTLLRRHGRAQSVCDALIIMRAYIAAGSPKQSAVPLGSFEEWSRLVRDALLWIGEADPVSTMEKTRGSDPRLLQLRGLLDLWEKVIGEDKRRSVRDLVREAFAVEGGIDGFDRPKNPDLRDLLLLLAGERGAVNARRLGRWLEAIKGRVVEGRRIVQAGLVSGLMTWKLELIER